jgi:hypothetical protein
VILALAGLALWPSDPSASSGPKGGRRKATSFSISACNVVEQVDIGRVVRRDQAFAFNYDAGLPITT